MGLNRELIGKKYKTDNPYNVTASSIKQFATSYNDDNPIYMSDAPFAPPVFAYVAGFMEMLKPLFDPELRCNLMKIVHGEHGMRFHKLIPTGAEIWTKTTIENIEEKASGETITLLIEEHDENGEEVLTSRALFFIRGKSKDEDDKKKQPPEEKESTWAKQIFSEPDKTEKDQSLKYAEASGDRNPIHTDETYAKSVGLPGIILHGMCTYAIAQKAIINAVLGRDPARLKEMFARFSGMVIPGEVITTRGGWLQEKDHSESSRVLGFETLNSKGERVLIRGKAVVI